jgi:hypothetical protein
MDGELCAERAGLAGGMCAEARLGEGGMEDE